MKRMVALAILCPPLALFCAGRRFQAFFCFVLYFLSSSQVFTFLIFAFSAIFWTIYSVYYLNNKKIIVKDLSDHFPVEQENTLVSTTSDAMKEGSQKYYTLAED